MKFFLLLSLIANCFLLIALFISCDHNDQNGEHSNGHKLFVTLQDSDSVAIIDSDNLNLLESITIDLNQINFSSIVNHHPLLIECPFQLAPDEEARYH